MSERIGETILANVTVVLYRVRSDRAPITLHEEKKLLELTPTF